MLVSKYYFHYLSKQKAFYEQQYCNSADSEDVQTIKFIRHKFKLI